MLLFLMIQEQLKLLVNLMLPLLILDLFKLPFNSLDGVMVIVSMLVLLLVLLNLLVIDVKKWIQLKLITYLSKQVFLLVLKFSKKVLLVKVLSMVKKQP
jgi:hypothetical protein